MLIVPVPPMNKAFIKLQPRSFDFAQDDIVDG